MNKGAILLISGPSGCGKSSLLKKLYAVIDNYYFSISTTTRSPRIGETDGVDYFFVTKEEFEQDIKDNSFLEWAEVHGNYYGTSLKPIYKALDEGKLVIFDIDVQGFEQVIEKLRDITTTVFITTPTLKELEQRLTARGTDTIDVIEKRIKNAQVEIKYTEEYDYLIINDDLDEAADKLISVAKSALIKSKMFDNTTLVKIWNS
ncbi:MAG: guanylate kinase [Arcobacteraceae bacterium]|nr:guanylate kinase [Arcobacteraceae bacterium]